MQVKVLAIVKKKCPKEQKEISIYLLLWTQLFFSCGGHSREPAIALLVGLTLNVYTSGPPAFHFKFSLSHLWHWELQRTMQIKST